MKDNNLLKHYNKLFWHLFAEYASFAIVQTKTHVKRREVRKVSVEFVQQHYSEFIQLPRNLRRSIKHINSHFWKISDAINHFRQNKLSRFAPLSRIQKWSLNDLRFLEEQSSKMRDQARVIRAELNKE